MWDAPIFWNIKIYWNISLFHDQAQEQEIRFLLITFIRTILRHENMGQLNFEKSFKFYSFSEIFYCLLQYDQTLEHEFGCFCVMPIQKNHCKKQNMGLFKKYLKFQNFNEIFYCGITRHRNTILNYCGLCWTWKLWN